LDCHRYSGSIGFEKLREGIADYEKIFILRELASRSSSGKVKELVKALDALLASLSNERNYSRRDLQPSAIKEAVFTGNRLIRDLSNEIGQ
jgi:hypothetical protein